MRTILLLIVAVVIGLAAPVQVQAQNWRDPNSGVLFWNGSLGGGGWGPGTYNYNYRSENPTLEKLFYVGGAVVTFHELLRYFKADKVEIKETAGGILVVNKTNGKVEFFPSYSQSTATHAVNRPRIEDWNGRDWGDPEIQEMKREARRIEEKADAIEQYTDAQNRLKEARQYSKTHRQVVTVKPANGDEKVKEPVEKKPQEQKIAPEPTLEEQGFIFNLDDLDNLDGSSFPPNEPISEKSGQNQKENKSAIPKKGWIQRKDGYWEKWPQ